MSGFMFNEADVLTVDEARAKFATTRETMLSRVCKEIADALAKIDAFNEGGAIGPFSLEKLETMNEAFSDWQTVQRERRENPQDEGDKKAQVISVDAIARKLNAERDTLNVRAIRKDGGVVFANAKAWQADIDARKAAGEDVEDEGDDA